jgi:NAD(P)-dependent dehydrogenase (short-subunit alcohol dehydrogenase family)
MPTLQPKLVVITGATRGLGRALAERFITLGHTVLGCGRSRDHVAALSKLYGAPHHFEVLDVANDGAVRGWAARVIASHGAPDLLINNAAIINPNARLWELSAAQFDPVIDINIKGVVNVIRHFVPAMVKRGNGVIVNFSSGWGRSTAPEVAPYCATKWAIEGLTGALAQELPGEMAAVPLSPGVIDTDMLRSCFGASAAQYPAPAEWAGAAVELLLKLGPRDNGKPLSVRWA